MKSLFWKGMNFWPPLFFTGIKIEKVAPDLSEMRVSLAHRFWNKNYVGTQYGGSLYSMTDPFYMLMLMKLLGKGYVVWDKSASIKFIKPGRSKVYAQFRLSKERLEEIKSHVDKEGRYLAEFVVEIVDDKNEKIAEVLKILSVKKKLV
jgi:acyl-coenzyme A thioesterase PaaI-like protein